MRLADIQEAVRDRFSAETIADPKLNRLIEAAVRFYSRYNPYLQQTTIATVSEQKRYDLPADCIHEMVLDVDYWPTGGLSYELSAAQEYETIQRRPASYDLISERVIEDIKQAEHIKRVRGDWTIENGQIALTPVPSGSSVTVYVTYGSVHALTGSTTYATIPDEDLDIMRDLTVAEILEAKAAEYAAEPDYAEGLQRITKHFMPENIDKVVQRLRGKCIQKYAGAAVEV
jgi:hypothetical protein